MHSHDSVALSPREVLRERAHERVEEATAVSMVSNYAEGEYRRRVRKIRPQFSGRHHRRYLRKRRVWLVYGLFYLVVVFLLSCLFAAHVGLLQ